MNTTYLSQVSTVERPATRPIARGRNAFLSIAALGAAWNIFGVVQFFKSLGASRETMMLGGMTAAQAEVYLALPAWMTLAFAVGVFGGLAGSLALAARSRHAVAVLAVSLLAYVALFAGDVQHGLFAVMPRQLPVLVLVVLIAAGLAVTAGVARRLQWLR